VNAPDVPHKAVLFDLDDTLIDRRRAFATFAERFFAAEPAVRAASTLEEATKLLIKWDARGATARPKLFELAQARWPGIDSDLEKQVRRFWAVLIAAFRPDEMVIKFLARLNDASMPWGIITNGGPQQFEKLAQVGLSGLPPFVITSEAFGASKPDASIFGEGLRRLGSRAQETLFVGDNPSADISGAAAVRMPTAWVRAGRKWWIYGDPVPDFEIDHVSELEKVVLPRAAR